MSTGTQALMEAVHDVARLAGGVALRYFRKNVAVERKADGSEVTIADRSAEEAARAWIDTRFPNDGILGEELQALDRSGPRRWYIDPIDGTRSFIRGVPLWGSMVAVEDHGTVLAGAIFCPAVDEIMVAARGAGCWHNGVRTFVSTVGSLSDATILATDERFRFHEGRSDRWRALARRVAVARSWGDCYGYILVATGRAELMADVRLSPWDVAPLLPIVAEAGGVFTDWEGRADTMGRDGLASNAVLAEPLRSALGVPTDRLSVR